MSSSYLTTVNAKRQKLVVDIQAATEAYTGAVKSASSLSPQQLTSTSANVYTEARVNDHVRPVASLFKEITRLDSEHRKICDLISTAYQGQELFKRFSEALTPRELAQACAVLASSVNYLLHTVVKTPGPLDGKDAVQADDQVHTLLDKISTIIGGGQGSPEELLHYYPDTDTIGAVHPSMLFPSTFQSDNPTKLFINKF